MGYYQKSFWSQKPWENRISNSNKIRLQTFFTFDIQNILKRLFTGDTSVSTYDYKLNDLDDNEIIVDLHFNKVEKKLVLLIIQEKDNFKTYMTQTSKTLSDLFISGFSDSLDRNISSPITNVLAAIELLKENNLYDFLLTFSSYLNANNWFIGRRN